ncbi:hypothetical protein CR155_12455 [Pollutimonas nitritireducens]|uniref:Cytochrome c-552/DMSO reductase-like haem-binding domain-containing protein n=1 Tax=Pollutimonas nitritireducens TaxID=2045209 RepID=A0A2N4UF24_9BURK|nr:ethylbenzene dehydrogenase-related protein [Pollutimonas nitritireducens]PLC53622.1 hypothetical protein CR155_12455 [Pollutimonas nitritireducens]
MSNDLRGKGLLAALVLFLGALLLSWFTHGTVVVHNDRERNIYIPDELTMPLQVKVAYNGTDIFFRYRWPAKQPSIYHDMLKFEGGKWVRLGKSVAGPQTEGIYEDRVSMMVDDGSVPEFARYGGYITIGDSMRFFTHEAKKEEVEAHPYLGRKRKQEEVRKYLPATRTDINDWRSVVPEDELAALRKGGYFLDLWHWRAHRGNPVNASDDEYVFDARSGDAGKAAFSTNWDPEKKQPKFMLDPQKTNHRALNWDDLAQRKLGFDDVYYITDDTAAPFDPNFAWKEGDTIPRRLLLRGRGDGSHADIRVLGSGRWKDGFWEVTLKRAMDTGHPADDKIFVDKRVYNLAFGVHRNANGSRWHNISLPVTLGLGRDADVVASRFEASEPSWDQQWKTVTLFYPGQVSWPMLNSVQHAGAEFIRKGQPVTTHHSEAQLTQYGIEAEFAEEIRRQWLRTLFAGIALIVSFGFALNQLLRSKQGD